MHRGYGNAGERPERAACTVDIEDYPGVIDFASGFFYEC